MLIRPSAYTATIRLPEKPKLKLTTGLPNLSS